MPKSTTTEVEVTFGLTLPKCSKRVARLLMLEFIGTIHNDLDNGDCPMDSYYEVFGAGNPIEEEFPDTDGYAYGFYDKKMKIKGALERMPRRKKSLMAG